jgi:uncharacterized protein YidB (DUF937 family)
MSLLQTIVGELAGGQAANPQQHQNTLLEGIVGLLNNPQIGGIGGLAKLFQNQGLGHIIAGWIGKGPNPPVTGSQLQQVLGSQHIADLAAKLGIDPQRAAAQLAAILPHAVDHLTPDGVLPADGSTSPQAALAALKSKFLYS